jgi:uridine kinase
MNDPHPANIAGKQMAVRPARRRDSAQARLCDGRIFEAPPGTPLTEITKIAFPDSSAPPVMAAVVNGQLKRLTAPLEYDSDVRLLTLEDADGVRIYRRSLSFLLLTAISELFPQAEVFFEHSATTSGAYFCELRGRLPFSQAELQAVEERMRRIVSDDEAFVESEVPVAEAAELFRNRGEEDKAALFEHREKKTVPLYTLRGRRDYFLGIMAPSTGSLHYFALHEFQYGFVLQFPHQSRPREMTPVTPYPKLFEVFEESGQWLERLGIRSAGALNDAIVAGRLAEISLVSEALHEARVARIAADIAARRPRVRIVLIAGPSSSGKTTFAKRLAVQLLANGLRPYPLALDDYYVDKELTPRDEKNEYDFESIRALNLDRFNTNLLDLIQGETVRLPHYDFATGRSNPGPEVRLAPDNITIVEGIHGLNPDLVPGLPSDVVYRIYVSALTQLNLDRHNRLNTTDCRLIRRIVRDADTRGYDATATLRRWDAVLAGEKKNIFPFQENCDAIFNSALVHELAVLRPLADPLLLQVRPDSPQYLESNRLLSLLQWFRKAPSDSVPSNSILREFVGGSMLEHFRTWP